MGCGSSKKAKANAPTLTRDEVVAARAAKAAATQSRKEKLNPADFLVSGRSGETIVKREGSIDGEQFCIENCRDCDIFLFDHLDSSFVDECENCRIFVGPVRSSIFIRTCKGCSFVIACRQFRTRDCSDCRFALFCTTQPSIETSVRVQFACFDFVYFSLREQIAQANLTLWNNKWWQIHDFNQNQENPTWSLMPEADVPSLLRAEECAGMPAEELAMDRVVPVTLGCRPRPVEECCFVVFLPQSEEFVEAFLARASRTEGWTLCRARSTALSEDRVKALFSWTKEKNLASRCKGKELVGVEVCGVGITSAVQKVLTTTGLSIGSANIRVIPAESASTMAKAFFEVWKDDI
mmetsp:Transcript_13588/g.25470  ORF Transcript_13588/g.25470 Transcript_13588/m.25470 type:complete len:351 (-) Transcript_13588:74-1126(-)